MKRIANAGYESTVFNAPDEVHNNLHGCCQYEIPNKDNQKQIKDEIKN